MNEQRLVSTKKNLARAETGNDQHQSLTSRFPPVSAKSLAASPPPILALAQQTVRLREGDFQI